MITGGCPSAAYTKATNSTNVGPGTNFTKSRLEAMRHMNRKGVTKVKIPNRDKQNELANQMQAVRSEVEKSSRNQA